MQVHIVDYGAGNTYSVRHALEMAGADPVMAATPEAILNADRLVLPGVGAAGLVVDHLRRDGLDQALSEVVRGKGRPMLGICVGMQVLAETLFEFGPHKGLGWIPGQVVDIHTLEGHGERVPHMGWSDVDVSSDAEDLFRNIRGNRQFYFCHSFTLQTDPDKVAATTDFGTPLVSAILDQTVFATQFHPEKSQINGQRLIENFLDWSP